jgi:lyso-ornithine lipid O-acyltransferase
LRHNKRQAKDLERRFDSTKARSALAMRRAVRAARVFVPLVFLTLILLPAQLLSVRFNWRLANIIPVIWHRTALWLLGAETRVVGEPAKERPVLIVANHISWLDILIIGARFPVAFVAKSEVAGWAGFGLLARLQRTVFVERTRRIATGDSVDAISERFARREAIVLFAEGTSHDGETVLPFRSSLLGAVRASDVAVQPLAIAYVANHGLPLGRVGRRRYAWMGDAELVPSLLDVIEGGPFTAELRFGETVPGSDDRKVLARSLHADVSRMLAAANTGR